jgi:hypothetical protein
MASKKSLASAYAVAHHGCNFSNGISAGMVMSEIPGTIPPAKGRPRLVERANVLHPFEQEKEVLEKRGARPTFLSIVWPMLIGGVLAFIAPRLLDFLTAPDAHLEWAARAVFPYVLLAGEPQFRMYGDYTSQLPQFILLAQFPLEGILTTFNLRRRMRVGWAIGMLIVIHLLGAFVLYLLTQY